MQLYAYKDSQLVFIDDAEKGVSYICQGCNEEVRVKGGRFLTRHFFHVKPRRRCTFRQRSMRHLAIQLAIKKLIPSTILEHQFSNLHRIADVYWPQKKIVFEVQSTPITAMEIAKRERDYNSIGLEVIWILSDHLFNKFYVTPAEEILRTRSTYYTSIGFNKEGIFYDQFEVIYQKKRLFRLPPIEVQITRPRKMDPHHLTLPHIARERENHSKIFFYGDIYDRCRQFPRFRKSLIKLEKRYRVTKYTIYREYYKKELKDLWLYYLAKIKPFLLQTAEATESRERRPEIE